MRSVGSLRPNFASGGWRRLWSDWADAQADLSLRWVHKSFCWFRHAVAQFSYFILQAFFLRTAKTDQSGRMPRLIWVSAGRTCHFVGFVMRRLECYCYICCSRSSVVYWHALELFIYCLEMFQCIYVSSLIWIIIHIREETYMHWKIYINQDMQIVWEWTTSYLNSIIALILWRCEKNCGTKTLSHLDITREMYQVENHVTP